MSEFAAPRNILIFHGTGGHPSENWFPWLKSELEKEGQKVFVPQFPHPKDHPLPDWLEVLKDYEKHINEDSILIGHSLGGLFLLRVLERLRHPIRAAFFVAAPVGVKPIRFYDSDYKFSGFDFNWPEIKTKAQDFKVYHSDNDPYVSLGNGEELASQLGVSLTFIPKAGHLNAESGYTKLELLLKDVDTMLGSQAK
jgi:uncharacterized protein